MKLSDNIDRDGDKDKLGSSVKGKDEPPTKQLGKGQWLRWSGSTKIDVLSLGIGSWHMTKDGQVSSLC